MLKISNTLTGNKEIFKPLHDDKVLMYVCGITPYDDAHIGHGRVYVTFDVLYRLLDLLGYKVTYCRNFTDIDDKILHKAFQQFGDKNLYARVTERVISHYLEDMHALNCINPKFQPRVTECIDDIIAFIEKLIANGSAYAVDGDVYFSVKNFADYGKLSKQKLDDLKVGARVEANEKKRDPLDFALWKGEKDKEFWKSPWGYGRPGWHIECSVMASSYLGKHIDIHGGGMDLIFPHHENEVAQSEALSGAPFSRYWMHNAFVRVNKEKMSKSLGNFFTLRDVFKQFDPMVIRFYYLSHHYRAPLDFAFEDIESVQKAYQRLVRVLSCATSQSKPTLADYESSPITQKMLAALLDDLNTQGMIGILFEHLDDIAKDQRECALVKSLLQSVLGLTLEPLAAKTVAVTPEIQRLLDERELARKNKDWARSDSLRDQLQALGVALQDKKL